MFRRKSATPAETADIKSGGKGRPTPTRREQEEANKARNKPPRTRRERAAAMSAQRNANSAKTRAALRTGDGRYLPARDRGPIKRFIRDYIDSQFLIAEILLPLMVVVLVLSFFGNRRLTIVLELLVLLIIAVAVVNSIILRFALRRQLKKRFPGQSYAQTTSYAVMRSLQMRLLRMPKPQVKIGQNLPETYH